jgi:histone deacetylase complex subunit SAP18
MSGTVDDTPAGTEEVTAPEAKEEERTAGEENPDSGKTEAPGDTSKTSERARSASAERDSRHERDRDTDTDRERERGRVRERHQSRDRGRSPPRNQESRIQRGATARDVPSTNGARRSWEKAPPQRIWEPSNGPRRGTLPQHSQPQPTPIDRGATCPLLLRVFLREGQHFSLEDFGRGPSNTQKLPKTEVQFFSWADTSLRELSEFIRQEYKPAQRRDARLLFALVYPDKMGKLVQREAGLVFMSGRYTSDESRTLRELKMQSGDFVNVAVLA